MAKLILKDSTELKAGDVFFFGATIEHKGTVLEVQPYKDIMRRECVKALVQVYHDGLTGWQYFQHKEKVRITSFYS